MAQARLDTCPNKAGCHRYLVPFFNSKARRRRTGNNFCHAHIDTTEEQSKHGSTTLGSGQHDLVAQWCQVLHNSIGPHADHWVLDVATWPSMVCS